MLAISSHLAAIASYIVLRVIYFGLMHAAAVLGSYMPHFGIPRNLIGAGTLLGFATARSETMGPVRPAGAPDAPDALRCPAMPCDAL